MKIELQAVQAQIEQYQAEQAGRQKKERDIPPIQFKILQRLASESECNWRRIDEISRDVKIPVDEAEVYIQGLKKLGLATFHPHEPGGGGWHRTTEGNRLVVAKRWAGEEPAPTKKYSDLSEIEESILEMLIGEDEGVNERLIHQSLEDNGVKITLNKVIWILETSLKRFVDYDPGEPTYGTGNTWFIADAGREYFAERDKL